ncbi:MAG TPA: helicase-related protein [Aquabacterium sp.]|nr:helicase-related protein [Aquabacterium sp.]
MPPDSVKLPHPSHLSRVPRHLGAAQVARIRQAAYNLPQVLRPDDFDDDERHAGSDKLLDGLGLVQLQKAAAGARPSRWIAPEHMDAALQHLAAVGNGPTVRALMQERSVLLDGLGIARVGRGWDRQLSQPLQLSTGDEVALAYREPIAADPVWDFYRSGERDALLQALGPAPGWPQAPEVLAHLESLLARSLSGHPDQIDSLLPRLRAECAQPQALPALLAACTRAQDRWEHQVGEMEALQGLSSDLAFQGYPDTFATARQLQRTVTLYVGPPNSGKTHAAFERLALARDGAYLAPLRLLALEGRDRLVARGVPCSLLTGEENVPAPDARIVSSTIEMVNTREAIDIAVIDEAQMLFDADRGWAWTQAIVGVPANELLIICSAYAVPAIENLLRLCGESCTVRPFERKQHVQLLPAAVPIALLKHGDAVVAFSRRDVLMLRDQIAANGHPVSVIYGALPPEVRRREAERYANGASHILVATDAIGMGLNLPIRRVLFSTMSKFDGVGDRPLNESEVHQIAGRAGRYGMHDEGFVGVLREAEPGAARELKELLPKLPRAPRGFKAPVAPGPWHLQTIAARLGLNKLRAVLDVFIHQLRLDDAHFQVAKLEQMLELAARLDDVAATLALNQRFIYAQAPTDTRNEGQLQDFLEWAWQHARHGEVQAPAFLEQVDEHSRLDRMELALRSCTLWLWLDLRFPGVYGQLDAVQDLRRRLNDGIERHLKAQKPLWQARGRTRR